MARGVHVGDGLIKSGLRHAAMLFVSGPTAEVGR
jgi:hypothetical protein